MITFFNGNARVRFEKGFRVRFVLTLARQNKILMARPRSGENSKVVAASTATKKTFNSRFWENAASADDEVESEAEEADIKREPDLASSSNQEFPLLEPNEKLKNFTSFGFQA